ncbi:type II toxin-antitoxin system VapC family toxin [Metallosphaera tengchongensis]|uniref:Type II toxin-antitoxin system VapC family toxin n=1 Tax=Metallosphaera tengchongensis TaxID=1532350 RepID=A0A6N0NZ63_9CREN|nr:hypothetical protein [Metallosphaera tengchongensis]QKR00829.1 type II toxin-antitoxin system VapC family toxin [Metallosphaera tengchongensis]
MSVYLDTSAIIKRYFAEENSDKLNEIFEGAWLGKIKVSFSTYNVGEVVGVVERLKNSWRVDEKVMKDVLDKFFNKILHLLRLGTLTLVPIYTKVIFKSIPILVNTKVGKASPFRAVM